MLFGEINGVDDTIANAINPVDKMQKAFGELATCFLAILDNLRNVESDSGRVQHRRGGEGVEAGGYLRQGPQGDGPGQGRGEGSAAHTYWGLSDGPERGGGVVACNGIWGEEDEDVRVWMYERGC